ncbi:MAG: endolytic transglycosylase MltG, partial [Actinomycetota bacterium]
MSELFDEAHPRRQARREAQRAHRTKRRRRTVVAIVLGLGLVAAAIAFAWPIVTGLFDSTPPPEDYAGPGSGEVVVEIPSGANGQDIGIILKDAGVVKTVDAFSAAFRDNPNSGSIQAGSYALMREMKSSDAVAALLDPANRAELTITVPEGFIAKQVYERIANVMEIPLDDVIAAASDAEAIGLPPEAGGNPEGWFAAATYSFAPTATATDILGTMVTKTVSNLESAGVPREDWQETLIIASIVEREGTPQYYGQIARVIDNRLTDTTADVGGRLQMDSTVLYGVGQ